MYDALAASMITISTFCLTRCHDDACAQHVHNEKLVASIDEKMCI